MEKLKKIVNFIYLKLRNMVSSIKGRVTLFYEFLTTATEKDFQEWKLKDDKSLLTIGIEKFIDTVVVYGFAGLMLSFASHTLINTTFTFKYVLSYSVAYWFLKKLLLMVVKKQE